MTTELKFNLDVDDIEWIKRKYKVISYINSEIGKFTPTKDNIWDYKKFCLIERNGKYGTVACWDEGDNVSGVCLFRVKILEED